MKLFTLLIIFFLSTQVQAQSACRCTCDITSRQLCASLYDIDHPCGFSCKHAPSAIPMGRSACPNERVYNPEKGVYEWRIYCEE